MQISELISLILGFLIGAAFAYSWFSKRDSTLAVRLEQAEKSLADLRDAEQENTSLKIQLAQAEEKARSDAEKLQWLASAEVKLREAFQSLASQSLQSNSEQFIKQAKEQLNQISERLRGDWGQQKERIKGLVDPLNEKLTKLDNQVVELEKKREGAYASIDEQIKSLVNAHNELQKTTNTLSTALRSSQTRGQWGEAQLRRVVELAGMVEHVDYEEQEGAGDSRPDMTVYLPNEGRLAVDAKAPMSHYLDAVNTPDGDSARASLLANHAKALKSRIDELSRKAYWSELGGDSPEMVIMFVPNDAALSAAFEADPNLLDYALQKKVMPATPVMLLALMKAVAYGWQQFALAENARQIAETGKELYSRISTFTGHLGAVGKNLDSAVGSYNKAIGSLESRVLPSAKRLREMGVANEEISPLPKIEQISRQLPSTEDV